MHANRWDSYFLEIALTSAHMSKDPNTRVGAVIVGPDKEVRSTGFNGLPRRIFDDPNILNNRDVKLKTIVHAEMNAIFNAARIGVSLKGCTLYLACCDDTAETWGGPPCTHCTLGVIQSGINQVIALPRKQVTKWTEDLNYAECLLKQAGVRFQEVEL